ncbi:MAG: hypothetical protein KC917_13935, partial [Candidatus Omnitrophica bacterium]|nr:hypothetical protein [Candidatus Omnitrophota bacterium]
GTETVAIVTMDMGQIQMENVHRIREQTKANCGVEKVLCIASHSHSTPNPPDDFPSADKPYIREMEKLIAESVCAAAANKQPAQIAVGWGTVHEGHNRRMVMDDGKAVMLWENRARIPTNPVDHSVGVIRIESIGGELLANLVNFSCHPVVLGPGNLLISADYPGAMMRRVEDSLGGQCMFLQGAAGDINPFWDKTDPSDGAFDQVEAMGKALGDEVIRVSKQLSNFKSDLGLSHKSQLIPIDYRSGVEPRYGPLEGEINTVLIGKELAIAAFPGEFFVDHALGLKKDALFEDTFFVGYCNGQLGYFPTIQACTEGGYGVDEASVVEIGTGEELVNRALVNLYYQAGKIVPPHPPELPHTEIIVRSEN